MTTSFLNPVPGDHNLQALRDFALEAPFEWRKEFEELIELREDAVEVEEIEERLDAVMDLTRDLVESIEEEMKDLHAATDGKAPAEVLAALDAHKTEVAELVADLAKALEELEVEGRTQKPVVLKEVQRSPTQKGTP